MQLLDPLFSNNIKKELILIRTVVSLLVTKSPILLLYDKIQVKYFDFSTLIESFLFAVDALFRELGVQPGGQIRYNDFVKALLTPVPDY